MAIPLLAESPLALPDSIGPYRARDYFELPDSPRCELLFGRIYVSPSPNPRHQLIAFLLCRELYSIAQKAGGRAFVAPLDVRLADHSVVQPDVIYVCGARSSIVDEKRVAGAPDLLIEILSPRTARRDRGEKLALYAESGVREVWLVDPAGRQIEILANDDGRFVVVLPTSPRYRSTQLPEVEIDFAAFWNEVEVNG